MEPDQAETAPWFKSAQCPGLAGDFRDEALTATVFDKDGMRVREYAVKMIECTGSRKLMWASIIWSLALASTVPLTFGQGDITAGCG